MDSGLKDPNKELHERILAFSDACYKVCEVYKQAGHNVVAAEYLRTAFFLDEAAAALVSAVEEAGKLPKAPAKAPSEGN